MIPRFQNPRPFLPFTTHTCVRFCAPLVLMCGPFALLTCHVCDFGLRDLDASMTSVAVAKYHPLA